MNSYSNDVMNHVDCVIKLDLYPQKVHSCSKNTRVFIYTIGYIAWVFV